MDFLSIAKRHVVSYSPVGLFLATIFFYASLTPSLVPRPVDLQGFLSGISMAAGYGLGVSIVWIWRYLELPIVVKKKQTALILMGVTGAAIIVISVFRATEWQNAIRRLMGLDAISSSHPLIVAVSAFFLAVSIIIVFRILLQAGRMVSRKLRKVIPRRISNVLSLVIIIVLVFLFLNNVIAKVYINSMDSAYAAIDQFTGDDFEQPTDEFNSGSPASLISWDTLSIKGKNFTTMRPTKEEISMFSGVEAKHPLRVYVGLHSAETDYDRAKLALNELIRVGAFNRSVLVIVTPTGSGWIDPGAVDTLEYLHNGDTAAVAMQYSYLPSSITLFVDSDLPSKSSQLVFKEIYDFWTTLSKDNRPRLYLYGVSLGALGSEASVQLFEIIGNPINGAVWSGTPFRSALSSYIRNSRTLDSTAWLPQFHDGSLVRFTGKSNTLAIPGSEWGPIRIVYIQHPSDPVVFFSSDLLFKEPEWLKGKRGPDVSPKLQWFPIVTFLQIAFDIQVATQAPPGYGHSYSPSSYIDAWVEVTQPNITENSIERLKEIFSSN